MSLSTIFKAFLTCSFIVASCTLVAQPTSAAGSLACSPSGFFQEKEVAQQEKGEGAKTIPAEIKPEKEEAPKTEKKDPSAYRSADFLPQSTRGWVAISSMDELENAIASTDFGQLANNEELKPVFENLRDQMMAWGNQQQEKFALNPELLLPFGNGEFCVAGVLNEAKRHAVVMLLDVAKKEQQVAQLMEKVAEELTKRGAEKSVEEFHKVKVTKWKFKEPKGIQKRETAFFAVVNDRLVISDDQEVFADVLNRLKAPGTPGCLSQNASFQSIEKKCAAKKEEIPPNVRWFIEPFGYIALLDQIKLKNKRNVVGGEQAGGQQEIAGKLKGQGFDGVKALGGSLWFATDELELLHRGFIYAPPVSEKDRFEKAAKWLLNFGDLQPRIESETWVPDTVASYATFRWDFEKGMTGVGILVDEIVGEDKWKSFLDLFKSGRRKIKIDILEAAKRLDGRITVISEYTEPYNLDSEKVVVGLRLKPGNTAFAVKSLEGVFGRQRKYWKNEKRGGKVYWISKDQEKDPDLEFEDDLEDDLGGDGELEQDLEGEEEQEPEPPLFKKKIFTVHENTLFFSNDLAYLMQIIKKSGSNSLDKKPDWKRVAEELNRRSPNPDCFRQFGRISKRLRLFYELLRQNEVPRDNGLLSKLLGKIEDAPKLKKLDGKKLPQDYEKVVAPYLGLAGWTLENDPNGWFFLGCILPKKKD